MSENRILSPEHQFDAVVNGKPTGLAGCTQTADCERAVHCLRADPRLPYRAPIRGTERWCTKLIPVGVAS